jgi:hypothetical protein
MEIFIDADGCPVVGITVDFAKKHGIPVTVVCDTSHQISYEGVKTVTVDKGADSADFKLANLIGKGDIAVTQDYGLAAMCLAKNAYALNQNGLVYTDDNIGALLDSRHTAKKIRMSGGRIKGPKKRQNSQNDDFLAALKKLTDEINKQ